ncbi:MAG: hypothetical protein AAFY28_06185 [Actinomycetota bacterium]
MRVVASGDDHANNGQVVGCLAVMPQRGQCFIDDLAVDDDAQWPAIVSAIVGQVPERPAVVAVPTADDALADALGVADAEMVSAYWIRSAAAGAAAAQALDGSAADLPRPVHTFGGAPFDPDAPNGFGFTTAAGSVVGLASVAAPPVYDPGGAVTLVDLVAGDDLDALLETTLAVAAERRDGLVTVVCAETNVGLRRALVAADFARTVDIYRLP